MTELVALDLPGGSTFVEALQRVWERGDAVFPLDRRLPPASRAALLASIRPGRLIDQSGERALPGGRPAEPGDAVVLATSGSTGTPKGVILTHHAVAASAQATTARLKVGATDRWLACMPLAHAGGFGVVTRALLSGTPLEVHDGFDAAAVDASEATLVSLVATALGRIDPDHFRLIVVGGSRPPANLPPHVVTTYGLTETGGGVVYDRLPLDGAELAITDDGEVLVRGPMLTRGYRDGTSPVDADGWLHTGDLGGIEPDGRLYVAGRRAELIITGGENVWPEQVEQVIAALPGIDQVAVAGVPDGEWGQRVVAWIVPVGEPPALDALRDAVGEVLPRFAAPRELHVVREIPRTSLGKVVRHLLVGQLNEGDTPAPPSIT